MEAFMCWRSPCVDPESRIFAHYSTVVLLPKHLCICVKHHQIKSTCMLFQCNHRLFLSIVLPNFLWNGFWALYQSFTLLKSILSGSILFKDFWHNVWKQSEKKCYQISVIAFEQIRQQGQTNFCQFTANHIFCLNSKFCTGNVDQTIKTCLLPFLSFFFVTNPLFTHFSTAQLLKAPRFFFKIWKI